MKKKAQGMSVNVIIIAAIALLVLVILAVLILRSGGQVNDGTGCRSSGGECQQTECITGFYENIAQSGTRGGCSEGEVCCLSLG